MSTFPSGPNQMLKSIRNLSVITAALAMQLLLRSSSLYIEGLGTVEQLAPPPSDSGPLEGPGSGHGLQGGLLPFKNLHKRHRLPAPRCSSLAHASRALPVVYFTCLILAQPLSRISEADSL